MRKLNLLLVLLPAVVLAGQCTSPLLTHSDTDSQREFQNIYQCVSQVPIEIGPIQHIVVTGNDRTSNNTTSYVNTTMQISIKPTQKNHRLVIKAQSTWSPSGTNEGYLTITRGNTNVAPTADGFLVNNSQDVELPFFVEYDDTVYNSTSTLTYSVAIKIAGGGNAWVNQNLSNWQMIAEEWPK